MAEVRIELEAPAHGWIAVTLVTDAASWRCVASSVLEGLTDLVSAALELVERLPARSVVLHEEPAATRLAFVTAGDRVQVNVTHHDDHRDAMLGKPGTAVLTASCDRLDLARVIWRGFRRLQGAVDAAAIAAGWPATFPAREVAQLGERLRERGARTR